MAENSSNGHGLSHDPLALLVGHPRSAILAGTDAQAAAKIVQARGGVARVATSGAAPSDAGEIDLAMLGGALESERDPADAVKKWAALLGDGGHLVIDLPRSGASAARGWLEGAGLEVLRIVDAAKEPVVARLAKSVRSLAGSPVSHKSVVVARKKPRAGKLSLTIGMLTLNEKEAIEPMIAEIRAVAPDAKLVIIDSSSDETPVLAAKNGARVVRQLPPRGHGPAMERLMYEAAKDTDALIYIDCDFTYPTANIPRVRELLESGVDLVNCSRTHHYPKHMPVPNFLANRFFAATAQAVHGIPTTDVHSGMRGYRSSMVRAFAFDGEGDALPLDTLILPAKYGYDVVEMPIPYAERVGPSKLAKLRGTAWTFIRIANMIGEGKRVRRGPRYKHIES